MGVPAVEASAVGRTRAVGARVSCPATIYHRRGRDQRVVQRHGITTDPDVLDAAHVVLLPRQAIVGTNCEQGDQTTV
jgi:hypothetical protein